MLKFGNAFVTFAGSSEPPPEPTGRWQYFKIEFEQVQSGSIFQMAELEFIDGNGSRIGGTTYEAIDGTLGTTYEHGGIIDYQYVDKLVDGDVLMKYCVRSGSNIYAIIKTDTPITPTQYRMCTGSDCATFTGRNPKNWKVYGSAVNLGRNDAGWELLDSHTNDYTMPDVNTTWFTFTFNHVVRIGAHLYKCVTIGNRRWLAENLYEPLSSFADQESSAAYYDSCWADFTNRDNSTGWGILYWIDGLINNTNGCRTQMNTLLAGTGFRLPTPSDFNDLLQVSTDWRTFMTSDYGGTDTYGFSGLKSGTSARDWNYAIEQSVANGSLGLFCDDSTNDTFFFINPSFNMSFFYCNYAYRVAIRICADL